MVERLILCAGLCFLLPVVGSSVLGEDGSSQVYSARLSALLKTGSSDPSEEQVRRLNESRQAFISFSEEYPRSQYADDSRFVFSYIEFMGALMVPPRDLDSAKQMIMMMDAAVGQYPNGRLEDLTYSVLRKELGDQAVGGAFFIPYSYIVEYMRAIMAAQTRDFKAAIELYGRLKDHLTPITNEAVATEIYVPLYIALLRCGRSRDAGELFNEVIAAHPGSVLESIKAGVDADEKNSKDNH
jgi:hypothetical protein